MLYRALYWLRCHSVMASQKKAGPSMVCDERESVESQWQRPLPRSRLGGDSRFVSSRNKEHCYLKEQVRDLDEDLHLPELTLMTYRQVQMIWCGGGDGTPNEMRDFVFVGK